MRAPLKLAIDAADSKARLEDLYLPCRPKRRTKAQIAREAGLEPLAETLLARPDQSPEQVASRYVQPNKGVIDSAAALEGARAILVERFSEDATLIGSLHEEVWSRGCLCSRVRAGQAEPGVKFADYFEFSEPLASLPSHRILALFRGEKEEVLTLQLIPDPATPDRGDPSAFERRIASRFKIVDHGRPGDRWLIDTPSLGGHPGAAPHTAEGRAGPEAERRQLSIMFCELVGSTPLATRLDPEDLRDVIGAYHRAVAEVIASFDGFVARYMGDGVLTYFGYPRAHEDDAERAVRAGLALVEAVRGDHFESPASCAPHR